MNLGETTCRPTGLEFETFAVTRAGQPIDLGCSDLVKPIELGEFGKVTPDGAGDQIEFVTNPRVSTSEHRGELSKLGELAGELNGGDIKFLYAPRRPGYLLPASFDSWRKSRLRALRQALNDSREGGKYGDEVIRVGNINAFHIHFGFPDPCSQEAVNACCALNAIAPAVLEWTHRTLRIPRYGRNCVWSRFAREERLPGPRWFSDFDTFHQWFESIPRLVRPVSGEGDKHTAEWTFDLEQPQTLGEPGAEGTCWHAVRLRIAQGTVEFRPLPTIADHVQALHLVLMLDQWIDRALHSIGSRQFASFDEAVASGCIPDFWGHPVPQDATEWQNRWLQF